MRRRISLLLAAVLAGTVLMLLGPAQPASAVYVCAGAGGAVIPAGLLYPVLLGLGGPGKDHTIDVLVGGPSVTKAFTFTFAAGGCVHPPSTTPTTPGAAGILKGYCGHSVGTGALGGDPFSYISFGTLLLITGHVVGVVSAIPTPGTGSCAHVATPVPTPASLPSGATAFNIQGAVVGLNCTNALPPTSTLVDLPQILQLVATGGMSVLGVHVDLGVHFWTTGVCAPSTAGLPPFP